MCSGSLGCDCGMFGLVELPDVMKKQDIAVLKWQKALLVAAYMHCLPYMGLWFVCIQTHTQVHTRTHTEHTSLKYRNTLYFFITILGSQRQVGEHFIDLYQVD